MERLEVDVESFPKGQTKILAFFVIHFYFLPSFRLFRSANVSVQNPDVFHFGRRGAMYLLVMEPLKVAAELPDVCNKSP